MKLGYAREYIGHKEVDFIDYNQKRRVERAQNRRSTFLEKDKENIIKNTNTHLKVSGSSSKILNQNHNGQPFKSKKSRVSVGLNDRNSNSFVSDRSYTPSLNPPNCSFEDIERRFKERRLYRLQKEKKEKLRDLRAKTKSKSKEINEKRPSALVNHGKGLRSRPSVVPGKNPLSQNRSIKPNKKNHHENASRRISQSKNSVKDKSG